MGASATEAEGILFSLVIAGAAVTRRQKKSPAQDNEGAAAGSGDGVDPQLRQAETEAARGARHFAMLQRFARSAAFMLRRVAKIGIIRKRSGKGGGTGWRNPGNEGWKTWQQQARAAKQRAKLARLALRVRKIPPAAPVRGVRMPAQAPPDDIGPS